MLNATIDKVLLDTQKVLTKADKATRRAFHRWGGLVRTIAKRSIRKSKKSAEPGQPPRSHSGELRNLIFYALTPDNEAVVGPLPFGKEPAAGLLEHGGMVTRDGKQVRYSPHPFMQPALEESEDKVPDMFRNSIR